MELSYAKTKLSKSCSEALKIHNSTPKHPFVKHYKRQERHKTSLECLISRPIQIAQEVNLKVNSTKFKILQNMAT